MNHGHEITNNETVEGCGTQTVAGCYYTNSSVLKQNPAAQNTMYEQV